MYNESRYRYKLSVIVAVYNVATYLDECLASLHRQKREDVEFIVVDDGSTDTSSTICDQWAVRDVRFKVIHQENKGSLLARKTGVMHSSGEWIAFLDGDDLFADAALEDICNLVDNSDSDIIQFYSDVFNYNSKNEYNETIDAINNIEGSFTKRQTIYKKCFHEHNISWTIWNKIYKSSLLKESYKHIKNIHLVCAEDAYMNFIVFFFTKKILIKKTRPLYLYRYSVGISTRKETLELFTKQLSEIKIVEYIREFLTNQSASSAFFDACSELEITLTNTAVYRMASLPKKDLSIGFHLFIDTYNPICYMPTLQDVFAERKDELACVAHAAFKQMDTKAQNTDISKTDKKVVGIFYHRYHNGGVERVISLHIPLFLSLGYRVVLFTEQSCPEKEYALPPEVIRVIVPNSYTQGRAKVFLAAMQTYGVTVLCHHACLSPLLLFDLLLCHAAGISCILICHGPMLTSMAIGANFPFNPPMVSMLAHTVCTLSSTEAYFYQQCGVNACYLPPPVVALPDEPTDISPSSSNRPVVIWIGRLSEDKNYKEALQIFKIICEQQHNILCYIVGSEDNKEHKYVQNFINRNKLQDNIIHIPYTQYINQYYKSSTIHLLTSSFESFSMVIAEGKMHALPLVTYALPWLELLKENKGYISVQPHDVKGAADAILTILNDEQLQQRLSHEALESIQPFLDYNLAGAWKELLESPQKIQPGVFQGDSASKIQILWKYIFSMYIEGHRKNSSEFSKEYIKKKLKSLPFINTLLPPASRRRIFVRNITKKLYNYIFKRNFS